jgi:hypothetical protein
MSWVGDEILALRTLFLDDEFYLPPTSAQLGLSGVVAELVGEDHRIPVIQLVTGLPIETTKMLTRFVFSKMIDEWLAKDGGQELAKPWRLNEHAREFLAACKAAVEDHPDVDPWRIDPFRL